MRELSEIVGELERELGTRGGEPVPLHGGITNRNYRLTLGAHEYVIRLHGRNTELLGIDRESERLATAAAASIGLAPQVAASSEGYLVTRYIPCAALARSDVAAEAHALGGALKAFHECSLELPSRFSVPALLERYALLVRRRGGALPEDYAHARAAAGRVEEALPPLPARPCHNDLLPGNIIRASERGSLMIVDWVYAGMGDPRFDLANLAVNSDLDPEREQRLLSSYLGHPPGERERAALSLMRIASDAREAAWGVLQGVISDLDFDFAAYAREHFQRMRAAVADPAFAQRLALLAG